MVWLRRDLRLDDQQLFAEHAADTSLLAPVFCLNPRDLAPAASCGTLAHLVGRLGPFTAKFLLESLHELRVQLRSRGSELFFRLGDPAQVLPEFIRSCGTAAVATSVLWHQEAGTEEQQDETNVRAALDGLATCCSCWGFTVHHPDDMPTTASKWASLAHPKQKYKHKGHSRTQGGHLAEGCVDVRAARFDGMPRVMGELRRCLKSGVRVREPVAAPDVLPAAPAEVEPGELPDLQTLYSTVESMFGVGLPAIHLAVQNAVKLPEGCSSTSAQLRGGELSGLERLQFVIQGAAAEHCERAGGDAAGATSAKLSTYLAVGALSPRRVYLEASNQRSTQWLASHLEMRDYFSLSALRDGVRLFSEYGHKEQGVRWQTLEGQAAENWRCWAVGATGVPLVDAAMRELWATGWMSNRCRQNCVSFLTKVSKESGSRCAD